MPPGTRGAAPERGEAREGNIPPAGLQGHDTRPSAVRGHLPSSRFASAGSPSVACRAMRQGPFDNAGRLRRESAESCAVRGPKTREGPQGGYPLRASPAHAVRGPGSMPPPCARIEKRPPRARRPALPQPCAAVLSAKAGLTAGFGMGPGDPRLCGRARGGRSPAASLWSLPGAPHRGDPGGRMAGTEEDYASRSVL